MTEKTILIVEDDTAISRALSAKLKIAGYVAHEALNGRMGLDIALKEHPDLILLDIVMPEMDGLSMLRELRKDPWGANAAVIILTNLNEAEKLSDAMERNVFDYLVKSDWTLDKVLERVQQKLAQHDPAQ